MGTECPDEKNIITRNFYIGKMLIALRHDWPLTTSLKQQRSIGGWKIFSD